MRPAPVANGVVGVTPSTSMRSGLAVVVSADLICAGVHERFSARSSAAAPATCGAAIEVPLTTAAMLLFAGFTAPPKGAGAADAQRVYAARISTPGAARSGFSRLIGLGPREVE